MREHLSESHDGVMTIYTANYPAKGTRAFETDQRMVPNDATSQRVRISLCHRK
jgi:hypothetical protein